MPAIPNGTVTFLFTDIEGSTKLWQDHPNVMRSALARHDQMLRLAIEDNDGYVFKAVGDAFCAAFITAPEALAAALASQIALATEPWETEVPLRVRMALHTGSAEERNGDYYGTVLNRVARLLAVGHGGQTLLSDVTHGLTQDALPPDTALLDLEQHRLKDLSRSEHVFQLLHPSLLADFPPLRSLDNPQMPNNLPQQLTSFIGREKETVEIKALLGKTRLLTLTGAGGSGKTRISLQVAADLLDGFPEGVWLVELASLTDPALVPQIVAQVLGVKEQAGHPIQRTVVDVLKRKHLLLILDNCEHLVAACAALAADLLGSCPGIHLLASSREPLNISGEQTYRVPSLSLPDPKQPQTVQSLSQYEAVTLFIERAQAVQSSFTVTNVNAPAVAQVCFHLDGIPLAIELAAARVRSLSVEQINTRLDQRFRLLTGGHRTALPRQQTLRAMIDWSYDLLSVSEKVLLCRLSVFANGWTLAAAEAVCVGGPVEDFEVLDILTALLDKSLVVADTAEHSMRYRLLETVRQYSADRLAESGGAETVRESHLSWCMALAESAAPELYGRDQALWVARLETEHDNLRAGLAWSEASTSDAVRELQLVGALSRFWSVRGYWSEGRVHLAAALARGGLARVTPERARVLNALGVLSLAQSNVEEPRVLHEEALAIFRAIGDRSGEADSILGLGSVKFGQNNWGEVRSLYEQALAIFREVGDRLGEAQSLTFVASQAFADFDMEAAPLLYEQALTIHRELGNIGGEAQSLFGLAEVAERYGDWAMARPLLEQALIIHREIGNRAGEAFSLNHLGVVKNALGDWAVAHSLYEQALVIFGEIGDRGGEAESLFGLAEVAEHQDDWASANSLYEHALEIWREIGFRYYELETLVTLGIKFRGQGKLAQACEFLAQHLIVYRKLYEVYPPVSALEEYALLALAEGDPVRSVRLAGVAQTGFESLPWFSPPYHQDTHEQMLSTAHAALGDEAFTAAWNQGLAMTTEEAIAYALGEG